MQRRRRDIKLKRQNSRSRRGFSMVELVVVAVIMMAVAAIAAPSFLNFIATNKLRSTMSRTSGMLQQARMQAVRMNTAIQVKTTTANGSPVGYADFDGDSSWDSNEPSVMLPSGVTAGSSGHPGDATTGLNYTPQTGSGVLPKFNSRGLPCVTSGSMCQNFDGTNQVGFVIYFQNTNPFGAPRWGAVTITPAGRIRTWLWNGSTYSSQ